MSDSDLPAFYCFTGINAHRLDRRQGARVEDRLGAAPAGASSDAATMRRQAAA